ncbi:hypothetical protein Tco_0495645 [Tanacetum coccineum]
MQEVILSYNGLGIPTRQILDSRGAIPSKTAADAKVAIQEMAEYSQKWQNGTSRSRSTETSDGLAAIQAQLNNLGRGIKKVNENVYAAQVRCEQCKGPHYTKDCPLKEEEKTLKEAYYMQFGRPFQGGGYRATTPGFYQRNNANPSDHMDHKSRKPTLRLHILIIPYPERRKTQGICPRISKCPLISETILVYAVLKIDVYKRKITLRVGEEKIIFKSVKPASSLVKRVYMLSLRERMELDLEARIMGETLVLDRSLDPFLEDNIELNYLNEPFELRRNQRDDLMPTIKEVLEDMDAYRDEGMGDVIFGEPFLREVGIKTKWFEGIITLCKSDDEVTYQMVRSHTRFKHHTNEQCNKIPPLLKVSEKDEKNEISHAYQKLKGFYMGVLNLGPDYIRDVRMEEWLTRGHISVHEME